MRVIWTDRARADLRRLHAFLVPKNPRAAASAMVALTEASGRLLARPNVGQRVETISDRTVRRIIVGANEIRYEVVDEDIRVARIFHTKEER